MKFERAIKLGKEAVQKYMLEQWKNVFGIYSEVTKGLRLVSSAIFEPVYTFPEGIFIGQLIAYLPRSDGMVEVVVGRVSRTGRITDIYVEPLKRFGISGPLIVSPEQLISFSFADKHNPAIDAQIIGVDIYGNKTVTIQGADFYERYTKLEREVNTYRSIMNRLISANDSLLRVKRALESEIALLRLEVQEYISRYMDMRRMYHRVLKERDELAALLQSTSKDEVKYASILLRDQLLESKIHDLESKIKFKRLEELREKYGIAESRPEKVSEGKTA